MLLHLQERPCVGWFPLHMFLLSPEPWEAGANPAQPWSHPCPRQLKLPRCPLHRLGELLSHGYGS